MFDNWVNAPFDQVVVMTSSTILVYELTGFLIRKFITKTERKVVKK